MSTQAYPKRITPEMRRELLAAWDRATSQMPGWTMAYGNATADWWIATKREFGFNLSSPYNVGCGGPL